MDRYVLSGALLVTLLLSVPAFADAGGDKALQLCATYMHSTYSVPPGDFASFHAQLVGPQAYTAHGHATYNGQMHAVDCTVRDGRVSAVEWQ